MHVTSGIASCLVCEQPALALALLSVELYENIFQAVLCDAGVQCPVRSFGLLCVWACGADGGVGE